MDHSLRTEFQAARASVERHGPQPLFQLPWEKGIWRRIFNPSPTPLAVISRSLPLPSSFPSSPNFQFNNTFNSDYNVNSNPNSSLLFLRILLQLNLQRNSGRNSLDTLTYKKDVQMVYVISLFQGSFQCWLLQQDHRCFYPRQTLGTFTLVSVLPCR